MDPNTTCQSNIDGILGVINRLVVTYAVPDEKPLVIVRVVKLLSEPKKAD